ncbi:MAG TPA: DivIVA domain-containing protein [Candidatus Acidoferrales bacterium]|nr:DivIVA domain-containing protein [Candidatus Acidoferrales bacterium]
MKLTPIQIRKAEFAKKMRGLDSEEVEAFLETIASDFEELLKENMELRAQKSVLTDELQNYKKMEDSLRSLVTQAERAASESSESLRRTSKIVEHEAEVKAQQILNEATQEMVRAKAKLAEVRNLRETIVKTIRTILTAQLDMLNSLENELLKQEPTAEILDIKSIVASIDKLGEENK